MRTGRDRPSVVPGWGAMPSEPRIVTILPISGKPFMQCFGKVMARFGAGLLAGAERIAQRRNPAGQVLHEGSGLHPSRRGDFIASAVELPQQALNLAASLAPPKGSVLVLFAAHYRARRLQLAKLMVDRPVTAAHLAPALDSRFHSAPPARGDPAGKPPQIFSHARHVTSSSRDRAPGNNRKRRFSRQLSPVRYAGVAAEDVRPIASAYFR
jgi:hypothetical protein